MNCSAGEFQIMKTLDSMGIEYMYNTSDNDFVKEYNKNLRFDFIVKTDSEPIYIEYDGRQHFKPVNFGGISIEKAQIRFEKQKKYDKMKDDFCNDKLFLRIKYTDFGNIPQKITNFMCQNSSWGYEDSFI